MSSALVNGVRRALAQRARTASVRTFNTSAPKRGGGGGDEPVRLRAAPARWIFTADGHFLVLGFPRSVSPRARARDV